MKKYFLLVFVLLAQSAYGGQPAAYLAVIDFAGKNAKIGKQLADSVRLRMRRHKEYQVIDRHTTAEFTSPLSASAEAKKVISLMTDKLGVNMCIYGWAEKQGDTVRAEVCLIDLRKSNDGKIAWKKTFSNDTERARGLIAMQIVQAVRGQSEWTPPQYGDREEPKNLRKSKPINVNGSFDAGADGWIGPDNAATFLELGAPGRNTILRIRTDLKRQPYIDYIRKLRFGLTNPAQGPKLNIPRDTSFTSLAGYEGVYYRSRWIKVKPPRRYWISAEMKGKSKGIFFPKIFVKGFCNCDYSAAAKGLPEQSLVELELTAEQFSNLPEKRRKELLAGDIRRYPMRYLRECYRSYIGCKNDGLAWKRYSTPIPPRGELPAKVQWLRIDIYAYWPPGTYYFDNVHLYPDKKR